MKKHCLSRAVQKLSPVRTTQANAIFAIPHCQVLPSPWVCCSQYLQEWNKVVLFQVITARLGQEVHKFRSVIVTGLQSSGEEKREQMVARLLPLLLLCSLYPFYHSQEHKFEIVPLKSASAGVIHSEIRILNRCLVIISVECCGSDGEIMQVSAVASHLRMAQS